MRPVVKIILYIGLAAACVLFALAFREIYLLKVQKIPVPADLSMGMNGFLALICFVLLGLLISRDISAYFADRAVKFIFSDESEEAKAPEYERAEEVWKNGDYLEAIRILREYYEEHPRAIYVAMRIAEIYEVDLKNPLAAALEYEQILKHKLPPERWGWAAIHLVNLYGKLGQTDKGESLLREINDKYPKTSAAKKARQRLGIPEPEPEPEKVVEPLVEEAKQGEHFQEKQEELVEPKKEEPKLPPGFRPKKH
ncbi:MAG: hypothetical protein N2487_03170 [Verrucomicrobiae bacterium]|nr:hypothetical protein [Verrucomicrobiae bacterium]